MITNHRRVVWAEELGIDMEKLRREHPETEPASDFHERDKVVALANQDRLHAWAVAHVYEDKLEGVF